MWKITTKKLTKIAMYYHPATAIHLFDLLDLLDLSWDYMGQFLSQLARWPVAVPGGKNEIDNHPH